MTSAVIGNATVVVVRSAPGGTDRYGDPLPGTDARLPLPGAVVAPRVREGSGEAFDRGRQGVIVGLTLYAPPGTDLRFTDRVEVDGGMFEVEGEPGRWASPWGGSLGGVEVALRRAEG